MLTDSIIERDDDSTIVEIPCVLGRRGEEESLHQLIVLRELDRNFRLTPAKIRELWVQAKKHKVLFSDYTDGKFLPFFDLLVDPRSVWIEIAKEGAPVGVIYMTKIVPFFDADFHFALWDSIGVGREPLALYGLEWLMDRYQLHRATARIPRYQRGTLQSAERVGFQYEGATREGVPYKGEWVDLLNFGILRSEVDAQIHQLW